jgi:hypothetical protein
MPTTAHKCIVHNPKTQKSVCNHFCWMVNLHLTQSTCAEPHPHPYDLYDLVLISERDPVPYTRCLALAGLFPGCFTTPRPPHASKYLPQLGSAWEAAWLATATPIQSTPSFSYPPSCPITSFHVHSPPHAPPTSWRGGSPVVIPRGRGQKETRPCARGHGRAKLCYPNQGWLEVPGRTCEKK